MHWYLVFGTVLFEIRAVLHWNKSVSATWVEKLPHSCTGYLRYY